MPHIHDKYDFTTSAFILHPTDQKILLLLHKKIGKWLQPGGHIELDENPLQALHHELQEETGLMPNDYEIIEPAEQPRTTGNNTQLPLPFYFNEHPFSDTHRHIDICYLVRAKTSKLTQHPEGAREIGWFTEQEITHMHSTGTMFDDTRDLCQWVFRKYC